MTARPEGIFKIIYSAVDNRRTLYSWIRV